MREEFLFKIKNGRIIYPEIPMNGLVCYLDARGKYNTDIYRGTLLDLSGNGNHGTLLNFGFNDESGYENDGLKFDGVDDYLRYSHSLEETDPRTIFMDIEIEQTAKEQGAVISLPFGITIADGNNYIYTRGSLGSYFNTGANTMTKGTHKFVITIESTLETGKLYYLGNVYATTPQAGIGSYHSDARRTGVVGRIKLNRAMLYNRVLTDEEITKLLTV